MPNTDFQNGVIIATVAGGTEIGITPTGNIDITKNGIYNVTEKATATVNIAGSSFEDGSVRNPFCSQVPFSVRLAELNGELIEEE